MNAFNMSDDAREELMQALQSCLVETDFSWGKKSCGKVRDTYDLGDRLAIVTTDRQSAFDRIVTSVPCKGQVLSAISAWWFDETSTLVPNHFLVAPDPNVMIVKKCRVFPIEFVVRGYLTGSTSTSLWTQYQKGVRDYCGTRQPEGMVKNQRLDAPIITPTTKEKVHDRPISPKEIVSEGWMTQAEWDEASEAALKLFAYGSTLAQSRGLLLVDTKYEFGRDDEGHIVLVDEIHTPDSSRYWSAASYGQRFAAGLEPESFDKEWLRLWYVKRCDPYHDAQLPPLPDEMRLSLASRYLTLYATIVGKPLPLSSSCLVPLAQRIEGNMAAHLRA